jgi:hypothetical protein
MQRQAKFYIKVSAITAAVLIIIGYTFFSTRHLIQGPLITIETPISGETSNSALIEVSGIARNINFISLNDRPIYIDDKGNFKEKLLLSPGLNIIELYAKDKFSREVVKHLEVVLTEEERIFIPSPSISTSTQATSTTESESGALPN